QVATKTLRLCIGRLLRKKESCFAGVPLDPSPIMPFPFFTKMSTRHVKGPREFLAAFLATISILSLTARAAEPEKARLTTEQAITVRKLKSCAGLRTAP